MLGAVQSNVPGNYKLYFKQKSKTPHLFRIHVKLLPTDSQMLRLRIAPTKTKMNPEHILQMQILLTALKQNEFPYLSLQ